MGNFSHGSLRNRLGDPSVSHKLLVGTRDSDEDGNQRLREVPTTSGREA